MYVKAAAATTTVLCQWGWNQSWLTCVEQNIFHRNKVYAQLFYETLLQYVMYFCNWFYQISIVIEWFYVTWILFVRIYWLFLSLMWKVVYFEAYIHSVTYDHLSLLPSWYKICFSVVMYTVHHSATDYCERLANRMWQDIRILNVCRWKIWTNDSLTDWIARFYILKCHIQLKSNPYRIF